MKTEYLLEEQVKNVLAALMPANRLVIEICLETGLRVGDVLSLRREQLESNNGFPLRETKTGKWRNVWLSDGLRRRVLAQAGPVWAFPARSGDGHRCRQAVWQDVKRAAKAFRLCQNVGAHSFRKVYAVRLMQMYGDLEMVRRAMGHDKVETTMIYALADKLLDSKGARVVR